MQFTSIDRASHCNSIIHQQRSDDAARPTHVHPGRTASGGLFRLAAVAAGLACMLALSACGGGGDVAVVQAPSQLEIGIVGGVGNYAPVQSGQVLDVAAPVGQSVEFDANEPVAWSFSVNGSPLFGNGTTVDIGGVTIRQDQVSPSRVVVDSFFYGPAVLPIDVLLTATSTVDAAQVSTIRLVLQ